MLTTATGFSGVMICGPPSADQIQLWLSAVSPTTCSQAADGPRGRGLAEDLSAVEQGVGHGLRR